MTVREAWEMGKSVYNTQERRPSILPREATQVCSLVEWPTPLLLTIEWIKNNEGKNEESQGKKWKELKSLNLKWQQNYLLCYSYKLNLFG